MFLWSKDIEVIAYRSSMVWRKKCLFESSHFPDIAPWIFYLPWKFLRFLLFSWFILRGKWDLFVFILFIYLFGEKALGVSSSWVFGACTLDTENPNNLLLSRDKTLSYLHLIWIQNCSSILEQSSLLFLNLTTATLPHGRHWEFFPNMFLRQLCSFD